MKNFFKDLAEKFVIISSDHEERARKLKEEKCLKLVGLENREEENIERYLKLRAEGKELEQSRFLSAHRVKLLEQIHESQKMLDCLDYLIYNMIRG